MNHTNSQQNLQEQALTFHQQGQFAQAEQIYIQLLHDNPLNADVLHLFGVLKHQTGNPLLAIEQIQKALAIQPDQFLFHNNIANAYKDTQQWDKALEHYAQAAAIAPDFWQANYNLGLLYLQFNRQTEALQTLTQTVNLNPPDPDPYFTLMNLLQESEQPETASTIYHQLLTAFPNYAFELTEQGNNLQSKGEFEEAKKCYLKAIFLRPDLGQAYNNLGYMYQAQGLLDLAEETYLKLLEIEPNLPYHVYSNLGQLYQHKQNYPKAIEQYKKALELNPSVIGNYNQLAFCYEREEAHFEAAQEYENILKIIHLNPHPELKDDDNVLIQYKHNYIDYLFLVACKMHAQRNVEQAKLFYEKILKEDPTHTKAAYWHSILTSIYSELPDEEQSAPAPEQSTIKLDIIIPVWGKAYIDMFLSFCLPSLLAQQNLPAWPYLATTQVRLYTTPEDWETLQASPLFIQAQQYVSFKFHPTSLFYQDKGTKYNLMSNMHRHAIEEARSQGASLLFIPPDSFYSDGLFPALAQNIQDNQDIIMVAGLFVNKESLENTIQPHLKEGNFSLSSTQCVELFIEHMSLNSKTAFFDHDQPYNSWPSQLFFWEDQQTIGMHGFHFHPLFIRHPLPLQEKEGTIDGIYLNKYYNQGHQFKVIADNQIVVLSLQSEEEAKALLNQKLSLNVNQKIKAIDRFKRNCASRLHDSFFNTPIQLKASHSYPHALPQKPLIHEFLLFFWKIEDYHHKKLFQDLIEYYESHKSFVYKYKLMSPTNICLYFIASAYCELGAIEKLITFLNQHKENFPTPALHNTFNPLAPWLNYPDIIKPLDNSELYNFDLKAIALAKDLLMWLILEARCQLRNENDQTDLILS